jgi:hypothetical protein
MADLTPPRYPDRVALTPVPRSGITVGTTGKVPFMLIAPRLRTRLRSRLPLVLAATATLVTASACEDDSPEDDTPGTEVDGTQVGDGGTDVDDLTGDGGAGTVLPADTTPGATDAPNPNAGGGGGTATTAP